MPEPIEYKKWINAGFRRIWLIVLILTLILVGVLNLLIDPFEMYGTGLIEPLRPNNYREKLDLFMAYQRQPGALILGNSRVEALNPETVEDITSLNCFNFGLPAACTDSVLASMKIAVEENQSPVELVIIGVEPLFFDPAGWITPKARLVPEFSKYYSDSQAFKTIYEKSIRLIEIEQLMSSLRVLGRTIGNIQELPVESYRSDGMATYPQFDMEIEAGTFDLEAVLDERVPHYPEGAFGLSDFTELSVSRLVLWEELINLCVERDIQIYAFMAPSHPRLLKLLQELDAMWIFQETSDFVERTVTDAGGVYRDYTNLESFEGNPDWFYDEVHMWTSNADLLLENLLADYKKQAGKDIE